MGVFLSRFRKKKTTIEVLETLDAKIKEIEEYGQTTEQRHKKIVGRLVIYSIVLYIITTFIFYFYCFPASLYDQLFYIIPLLLFPILILFTKKLVSWYYKRKISRNHTKLTTMQQEKKKILEDVTETETYKKAKEILMKFAPDQLRITSPTTLSKVVPRIETPRRPSTPQAVVPPLPGAFELRRRALTVSNLQSNKQTGRVGDTGRVSIGAASMHTPLTSTPFQSTVRSVNVSATSPRSPLPRPILSQHRSYLDRLVEYLVGDGPSNRYALICRQCDSHNGMALKEEFEYFGFRCCYCNFWNPARKQKPSAPKLEHDIGTTVSTSASADQQSASKIPTLSTSQQMAELEREVSSSVSDTDSDIEVVEKPIEAADVAVQNVEENLNDKEQDTGAVDVSESKSQEVSEKEEDEKKVIPTEPMEVDESPRK